MSFGIRFRPPGAVDTTNATQAPTAPPPAPPPPPPPPAPLAPVDSFEPANRIGAKLNLTGQTTPPPSLGKAGILGSSLAETSTELPPGAFELTNPPMGPFSGSATYEKTDSVKEAEGITTVTMETEMAVSGGASIENKKQLEFGVEKTYGVKAEYELKMPTAEYEKLKNKQIPTPDPARPETMPEGTSITLNDSRFSGTTLSGAFRGISAESGLTQGKGNSFSVDKTGPTTIQVTAGPTEAVESRGSLGLSVGPASIGVGNTKSLETFRLKTAEFDVGTPEGKAAYEQFLKDGTFPAQDGPGVAKSATVEKLNAESATSLDVGLGPFEASVNINDTRLEYVKTTYADGSYDRSFDAKLHNGTPVRIEQHFNADNTEDTSKTEVSLFLEGAKGDVEEQFARNFQSKENTEVDQSAFDKENDVLLTLNAEDAMALSDRAKKYVENWQKEHKGESRRGQDDTFPPNRLIDALANAKTPAEVGSALMEAYGGEGWTSETFDYLARTNGKFEPLPGVIEARHRDAYSPD
ncbi:hypothetical protein HUA74_22840 [Myxococcus sp. CA051A]|uniref:hypothetical protein n=2 Tax=Myxococcus TaxID=32 RepID=UPI00157AEE13|nr:MULTISPECIES: hypothetical protein [unclassified Myxococcus]NTX17677.1 hypothetical protein [Myxococcus sp. CA056]NTX63494.1 hypothetical protein [Myxococcus sp. CA051A]